MVLVYMNVSKAMSETSHVLMVHATHWQLVIRNLPSGNLT